MASIGEKITRTIAKDSFVTDEQSGVVVVASCAQGLALAVLPSPIGGIVFRGHRHPGQHLKSNARGSNPPAAIAPCSHQGGKPGNGSILTRTPFFKM
jgi:hypothetical protein